MDINIFILLIIVIVLFFVTLKYSMNIFLYAGIVVLSVIGLLLTFTQGVDVIKGYNTTIINSDIQNLEVHTTPIYNNLESWEYVFYLTFISFMIGGVIFWTMDNPRERDH